MSILQIVAALIGALGGAGGIALALRAGAQNRRDDAGSRRELAEAKSIELRTARELIAEVRLEMDRKVTALEREVGRLHGRLEASNEERDTLRESERTLREENRSLRNRVDELERQVRELSARPTV